MVPKHDAALQDIPTGALLMKVLQRAQGGQRPESRLSWQWCSMLEGLMVPLLRSLPSSILDATDPPESKHGMSVMDRIMIQQKLSEARRFDENRIEKLGGDDA